MAFNWTAASITITGLDGRTHYRAEPLDQPPSTGLIPVLCGRLISPAALVTPDGKNCPDCMPAPAHPPRVRRDGPRAAHQLRPSRNGHGDRWWQRLGRTTTTRFLLIWAFLLFALLETGPGAGRGRTSMTAPGMWRGRGDDPVTDMLVVDMTAERRHELERVMIEFLHADPGRARRLLADHVDDGTGRCRTCQDTARGARQTWPCRLYELVSLAMSGTRQ